MIAAIVMLYPNFYNLAGALLVDGHHVYQKTLHKLLRSSNDYDEEDVTKVTGVGRSLELIMNEALNHRENTGDRADWGEWNPFSQDYDGHRSEKKKRFMERIQDSYVQDRNISKANQKLMFDEMSLLMFVLIMLGSQSQLDAKCKKCFYRLINGRHDCKSFLDMLKKCSIREFFEYFSDIYEPNGGIHQLKAHSLITLLIPLQTIYNGKVPPNMLEMFPELGGKKSCVALNGYGIYRGVGGDTHVLRLVQLLLKCDKEKAKKILGKIPIDGGLNFNDDVGELAQQLVRKGESRDWAIGVYNQLAEANKDFGKIYPELLAAYHVVLE